MQIILALLSRYRKSLPDDIFAHPIELIWNSVVDDFFCCRGEYKQTLHILSKFGTENSWWNRNMTDFTRLEICDLFCFRLLSMLNKIRNSLFFSWCSTNFLRNNSAWLKSVYTAVSVSNCDKHSSSILIILAYDEYALSNHVC